MEFVLQLIASFQRAFALDVKYSTRVVANVESVELTGYKVINDEGAIRHYASAYRIFYRVEHFAGKEHWDYTYPCTELVRHFELS